MKTQNRLFYLFLTTLAGWAAAGCVYHHDRAYIAPPPATVTVTTGPAPAPAPAVVAEPPPGTVVATGQVPPPAPYEAVTVAPGPDYVWVGGYWNWNGAWVWAPGHYVLRPWRGAVWAGGYWRHRGGRMIWVQGRWR